MPESIQELKNRLRQTYLGKAGIHGVGINRVGQVIRVYVGDHGQPDEEEVLEQLRRSAEPFPVQVIREEPPNLLESTRSDASP
jgi:hypothetical protein